jgi:cyclopropane fatty-acyl-phospholipid synthase-like methyltransferase
MKIDLVREGYDKVASAYLASRDRLKSGKYIQQLLKYLPKNSIILDLGCGAGVPVDDVLLKAGHQVIGLDISREQIKLAGKLCPRGQFIVGDIQDLEMGQYEVQAVVSFYTIFHVSRNKQQDLLEVMASFLPKGGMMLVTMGDREFEGAHDLHGAPMWSSQFGTTKNRKMVESVGFRIITDELDRSGGECHQVLMGQKL